MKIKTDAQIILHLAKAIGQVQQGRYFVARDQVEKALSKLTNKLDS